HELRDAEPARRQTDDRIEHELTGPVIRRAAAALCPRTHDTARRELCRRDVEIGVCSQSPEGDRRWVLERQNDVRSPGRAGAPALGSCGRSTTQCSATTTAARRWTSTMSCGAAGWSCAAWARS